MSDGVRLLRNDLSEANFRRAEDAWLAPPEPRECECDPDDEHTCDICMDVDEDYMKDPDRARDERIDREMDTEYWEDKYGGDDCLD
ncbi:MAG: hypothetical protein QQN63_07255 [Nitrosopumilus sp.]